MDPSASELQQFTSLADVLAWIGFADEADRKVWETFSKALGKPKLIRQVAAIPFAVYQRTVEHWKVSQKEGEDWAEVEPSPLELGHAGVLRRVSRLLCNLDPDEEKVPATTAQAGAGAGMPAMIAQAVSAG
jgi:hypothetical protein